MYQELTEEQKAEQDRAYEEREAQEREEEAARYTQFKGFVLAVCAELMQWDSRPWTIEEDDDISNRRWSPAITLRRADHVGLYAGYANPRLSGDPGKVTFSPTVPRSLHGEAYRARPYNAESHSKGFAVNRVPRHVAKALWKGVVPHAVSELAAAQKQRSIEEQAKADVARIAEDLVGVAPADLRVMTPGGSRNDEYTRMVLFVVSGSGYHDLTMHTVVTCHPGATHPHSIKIKLDDVPIELAQAVLKLVAAEKRKGGEKGE
jgi:hypothetical protein